MSEEHSDHALSGMLDDLELLTRGRSVVMLGQVIDCLGSRGFGPILMVFSLLQILPVGMAPGVPGIVGALTLLIGVLMLIGSRRLHLPGRLRRIPLPARIIRGTAEWATPHTHKLHRMLHPRLTFLIEGLIPLRILALILIPTGLLMLVIGFIPGLPFLMSIHVLLFGIALATRDGLVAVLGYAVCLPEIWLISRFWPQSLEVPWFS